MLARIRSFQKIDDKQRRKGEQQSRAQAQEHFDRSPEDRDGIIAGCGGRQKPGKARSAVMRPLF